MKHLKEQNQLELELKLTKDYLKIVKLLKKIYKLDFDFDENRTFWKEPMEKLIFQYENIFDDFKNNTEISNNFFKMLDNSGIKYDIKINNTISIKIYVKDNTNKLISELEKLVTPNDKLNTKMTNKTKKLLIKYQTNSKYVTVDSEEEMRLIQLVKNLENSIGYFDTSDEKEISNLDEEIYRYLQKTNKDKKLYDIFDCCDFEPDTIKYLSRRLKTYQTDEYYNPILNQLEKVIIMLTAME